MSIVGYLTADHTKKNLHVERAAEQRDGQSGPSNLEELPGGLVRSDQTGGTYDDVEEYDSVLRWHCRL